MPLRLPHDLAFSAGRRSGNTFSRAAAANTRAFEFVSKERNQVQPLSCARATCIVSIVPALSRAPNRLISSIVLKSGFFDVTNWAIVAVNQLPDLG